MVPRPTIHDVLADISPNVYFQPPASVRMSYPCIRYMRDGSDNDRADNVLYRHCKRYQVTVIDRNPNSELPDQVEQLPMCEFDRAYSSDDLNHWVFSLFY